MAKDFKDRFNDVRLDEEEWNQSHQIVVVAAELDDSTERITKYLSDEGVYVNVLFFQVFEYGGEKLLSRAWLVDPGGTQFESAGKAKVKEERQPWNGEYHVSYGFRSWEDARRYGFVSGGGGPFYSRTLKMLSPKDRIWVNLPGKGYAGVGTITESRRPITELEVETPEGPKPALEVLENAAEYERRSQDPDYAEYYVRVEWLDTNRSLRQSGSWDFRKPEHRVPTQDSKVADYCRTAKDVVPKLAGIETCLRPLPLHQGSSFTISLFNRVV